MVGRDVSELLRDFAGVQARARELTLEERKGLDAYNDFIQRQAHLIQRHPGALTALAYAQPEGSRILQDARATEAGKNFDWPWFRLRHPPEMDPEAHILGPFSAS